jgi:hypothetical protein
VFFRASRDAVLDTAMIYINSANPIPTGPESRLLMQKNPENQIRKMRWWEYKLKMKD